jgi:hypothetical protein
MRFVNTLSPIGVESVNGVCDNHTLSVASDQRATEGPVGWLRTTDLLFMPLELLQDRRDVLLH